MSDTHEIVQAGKAEIIDYDVTDNVHPLMKLAMNNPSILTTDVMSNLMDLQERHEKNEAMKAFNRDFVALKSELPSTIEKDKHASFKNTKYGWASLESIMEVVTPILMRHGFGMSWRNEPREDGRIAVVAELSHRLGHSKQNVSPPVNPDTSGSKNAIQAHGSALTYLTRYTVLGLLGIAQKDSPDADDDVKEFVDAQRNLKMVAAIKDRGIALEEITDEYGPVQNWTNRDLDKIWESIKGIKI